MQSRIHHPTILKPSALAIPSDETSTMPIHNREIATKLNRLANLLEIEGANSFRVRAYRKAASTVRGYPRSMSDMLDDGENLSKLPNIGDDLAEKIQTMVMTGELPLLQEVEDRTPPALSELMKIEGLGPKRVRKLYEELDIQSLNDLEEAIKAGKVQKISGFGNKSAEKIKQRLEKYSGNEQRTLLIDAEEIAGPLLDYLKDAKGIGNIIITGSYRRRKETVGDLDILITAKDSSPVMNHFIRYDDVEEVVSKGETRSTVYLHSGMQVDVRVVPEESYGAAKIYFTGSKAHNIALRKLGTKKGYKINEYGVFEDNERIAGETEESVYECIDRKYIEPELRENRGELDAAADGSLPRLITLSDIRGNLHAHTKASDGHHSLKEMAKAAEKLGYEYLAITEHSRSLSIASGLDRDQLSRHLDEIDELNAQLENIVLLKSSEVDILEDGRLDYPDDILKKLDFTVCAIHQKFDLSRKKQTERILRAMDNPYFHVLAHPSGRLINERDPYDTNLEKILEAAKERGCFIELNAQPQRLDLTDEGCKMAKDMGVRISIASDAHSTSDLKHMRCGIDQARRGWLEVKDVINCLPRNQLLELFKR